MSSTPNLLIPTLMRQLPRHLTQYSEQSRGRQVVLPILDQALKLLSGKSLHAPNLIDHEIISVAAKKDNANTRTTVTRGLEGFRKLRLPRHIIDQQAQFELALEQNLSAYDAAYLQLAVSPNAPLATYDRVLASAAKNTL